MRTKYKYELQAMQGFYIIAWYGYSNGPLFLKSKYNNRYTWSYDYAHARRYNYTTACKHVETLKKAIHAGATEK